MSFNTKPHGFMDGGGGLCGECGHGITYGLHDKPAPSSPVQMDAGARELVNTILLHFGVSDNPEQRIYIHGLIAGHYLSLAKAASEEAQHEIYDLWRKAKSDFGQASYQKIVREIIYNSFVKQSKGGNR